MPYSPLRLCVVAEFIDNGKAFRMISATVEQCCCKHWYPKGNELKEREESMSGVECAVRVLLLFIVCW